MLVRIQFLVFFLILSIAKADCQTAVPITFVSDTMSITGKEEIVEGEYIETVLKNLSVVRLFKTNDGHFYIRFIITKNFYFDKVDVLEIKSGSKSYYAKDTRQFKVDKNSGLYIVEIFPNYINTIKNNGITGLYFAQAETKFTRQDANQIRKIAEFFYDSITASK